MPRTARQDRHQSLEELGLVSASVIHEVRNALQGIHSALFLLERDPTLRQKAREWIAGAQRELARAFEASRQTLSLVREDPPAQVSVTAVLDEVLAACSDKTADRGITIERSYGFTGHIEANEGAVREVFTNLILNAVEAAPRQSGRLEIHTSPATRTNGSEVSGVQIRISDNGPGIPEKDQKKVFEPLFSTKKGKGTGLGLWVSHRLVRQQHGVLRLASSTSGANAGSSFSVFLPLKQN